MSRLPTLKKYHLSDAKACSYEIEMLMSDCQECVKTSGIQVRMLCSEGLFTLKRVRTEQSVTNNTS